MDQDMAAYENQTSSLAEDLMEQRNAIDEVNQEISKNQADKEEISEDVAQQERRTSSLEKDMAEQRNDFLLSPI